jgi:predicted dienelactone hydrolase
MSENGGKDSPFCARIATDQIAVSGWSCGGLQALINAGDPRVKTG